MKKVKKEREDRHAPLARREVKGELERAGESGRAQAFCAGEKNEFCDIDMSRHQKSIIMHDVVSSGIYFVYEG